MTDEIMIDRLGAAYDREISRFHFGCSPYDDEEEENDKNDTYHWDEWMIDHRIDIYLEDHMI